MTCKVSEALTSIIYPMLSPLQTEGYPTEDYPPLCSNQYFAIIMIKLSPQKVLIHGPNLANITASNWSNGTNRKGFSYLIINTKLSPLEITYIPSSIIRVPTMWITCKINYPLICTWCNLTTSSNRKGIIYVPL